MHRWLRTLMGTAGLLALAGCMQGTPQMGTGGSIAQGSAGAAGTQGGQQLERCDTPLGAAALIEPDTGVIVLLGSLGLSTPTPVLRLFMAQSNCFQVVDRGVAADLMEQERQRSGKNVQLKAADYFVQPNLLFSNPDAGGLDAGAALGGLLGSTGALLGNLAGSMRTQEAQAVLFVTDVGNGVQVTAAEGSASVTDYGGAVGLGSWGGTVSGLAGISGYGNTAEGKLIVAALMDSFNKTVVQLRAMK